MTAVIRKANPMHHGFIAKGDKLSMDVKDGILRVYNGKRIIYICDWERVGEAYLTDDVVTEAGAII